MKWFLELTARAGDSYVNRLRLLRRFDVRDRTERVPLLMRVLQGHGHISLIAPDPDLREILAEWLPEVSPRVDQLASR